MNYVNLQGKENTTLDHSLFFWAFSFYFTKIFVNLSVISQYVISVFINL